MHAIHHTTGAATVCGVIGDPIAHSLSPRIHNTWLAQGGIDGLYVPFRLPPDQLDSGLLGIQAAGVRGVNVTIPHKEAVHAWCTAHDPSAVTIGSVNTLTLNRVDATGGHVTCRLGASSDGYGFMADCRQQGIELAGKTICVLGAGGAASSVIDALLRAPAKQVILINRTDARAANIAASFNNSRLAWLPWTTWLDQGERNPGERTPLQGSDEPSSMRQNVADDADTLADVGVFVNCSALGLQGEADSKQLTAILSPLTKLPSFQQGSLQVYDIVYSRGMSTPIVRWALTHGLWASDGLGMLVHQAVVGFRQWFGHEPDADAVFVQSLRQSV